MEHTLGPSIDVYRFIVLLLLPGYESTFARHPPVPTRFLHNPSLALAWIRGLLDAFAFSVTYTYMYAWSTVVHNYSTRDATSLVNTAGCTQVIVGLLTGWLMYQTWKDKWILVIGVFVRLIGYGVMLRLRGSDNTTAELFVVQFIQGTGSGIIQTILLVICRSSSLEPSSHNPQLWFCC
jgi:Na+/melibiose symporter-like transporter